MTRIDQARANSGQASPRLTGWKASTVWMMVPIDITMILGSFAIIGSTDGTPIAAVLIAALLIASAVGSFGVVGSLLVTRLPQNPIGWILWAAAAVIAGSIFGNTYATLSVTSYGGALTATVPIAFVAQADLVPLLGSIGIFVPMHFPDGRLPSARWNKVATLSFVAVAVASVLAAVTPGPLSGGSEIPNPLGMSALEGAGNLIGLLLLVALLGPFLLAVASLVARYRGGGPIERQQLRWFVGAVTLMLFLVAVGSTNIGPLAEIGWLLLIAGIALLPIAIGIAIFRYRLYEIDRIISRTISWAIVTGVLVTVFAAVVVGLQAILANITHGQTLAVAASTLVAFALFQPVRRRVQATVDRRFDRAGYDAQRTTDGFAERLREEVNLEKLGVALTTATSDAMRPTEVSIWLRDQPAAVGRGEVW